MDVAPVVVLIFCAMFAALMREIYGNKGMFILPKKTERSIALGSLVTIVAAVFAVLLNIGMIADEISIGVAVSLGISWGIAAPDIVANLFAQVLEKQEG